MARIVYGVSGEGSGHSSRARVVLNHLLAAGHRVRAVSYDRGYRNLAGDFEVFETEGLHIAATDNRVSVVKTFTDNLARLPDGIARVRELRRRLFKGFRPHCVITDLEPTTAYLAHHYDLPLVTIDNQHRMRYMRYPLPARPRHLRKDALVAESVVRALVPRPDVSLVTTFYFGEVENRRTFLFPPILRRKVHELAPADGGHVLVYFTQAFASFLERLREFPRQRFVVYGQPPAAGFDNVTFRPFGDHFLADLAAARAVVATAGFTLMTEALHLGKPLLALPMKGQFEQELNALLLAAAGYGKNGRSAGGETLGDFFYRLPDYRSRLAGYPRRDNDALLARLDRLLADDCAELRRFHAERDANSRPPDGGGPGGDPAPTANGRRRSTRPPAV